MASESTRERILDVAEELFANDGIAATSLRTITHKAGVNLAAVHYHFGSKEALLGAVIERRARPVNAARTARLDALERDAGPEGPDVESLLAAFFLPAVSEWRALGPRAAHLARLLPRIEAQPPESVEALFRDHFGEVCRRVLEALERALPELPKPVVAERLRFTGAVMSHLFSGNFDLDVIPGHPPEKRSTGDRVEHALRFLAAGMRISDAATTGTQDV